MRYRGILEEGDEGQFDANQRMQPRNDFEGLKRVAAEIEKIVIRPDVLATQDFGPNLRDRVAHGPGVHALLASRFHLTA